MKSTLFIFTAGYLLLILETSWGSGLQFGQIRIDGLVALLVWHSLRKELPGGLLPVMGLGILAGLFSDLAAGLFPLAYSVGYLLVRYVLNQVDCGHTWQKALLVLFASFGVMVILLTGSGATELVWPWGIAQAVSNGMTSPVWFRLFDGTAKLANRFQGVRVQE